MHPLLTLVATRPQLLTDHAQAYAALFNEEFGLASSAWRRWALLQAVALCCLGVAAILAGGAWMLWAVTPAPDIHAHWVLYATPLFPMGLALVCLLAARQQMQATQFANLHQHLLADAALLRAASTS